MTDKGVFRDLFNEAFPSVSAQTRARFRSFLAGERLDYKWLYAPSLIEHLSQGDIVASFPTFFLGDGRVRVSKEPVPVLLLEHTCNMSVDSGEARNEFYTFAPLFPFSNYAATFENDVDLRKNHISHKVFLGSIPAIGSEFVADLTMISTISAEYLHRCLSTNQAERVGSLSDSGFFFLLAKLATHFLRADKRADDRFDSTA